MSAPQQPPRRGAAYVVAVVVMALVIFVLGVLVGGHPRQSGLDQLPAGARNLLVGGSTGSLPDQVLNVLADRYRGEVDRNKLEQVGATAIAASLGNRWTRYFTPDQYRDLKRASEGTYTGIGIRAKPAKAGIAIREVFPGSPADTAGLVKGDVITSVGGIPVARRGQARSVLAIGGKPGTVVVLGVTATDGVKRTVKVTRGDVTVPLVEGKLVTAPGGCKVAVVALDRFDQGAGEAVADKVAALRAKGATAVILDLRGDPGGLVDEAVAVAGNFLKPGEVVVSTKGRTSPEEVLKADGDPIPAGIPVTVLVDRNSASASEIVTGALKDHGRALVVGTPTFGKSEVQVTVPTTDGGAVKVTVAGYLTPKGTDIGKKGVQPDVRAVDDPRTGADEALQVALARACTGKA
ncbi:MAG: S41 family peptidase [Miltoncostaeaceae bacterium]